MGKFEETASLTWEWLESIAQCSQTSDPDKEGLRVYVRLKSMKRQTESCMTG